MTPIALKPGSILAWVEVGNSGTDPTRRNISSWWGLLEHGPRWFLENRVQPAMPLCDGFYAHNIFGTPGGLMEIDAWPEALRLGLFDIGDEADFREAVREFRNANPGKFLGAYLGDIRTLLAHETDPVNRWDRIRDSLSPFLGVFDELCFDGANNYRPGDAGYGLVSLLAALGIPCRIEAARSDPTSLNLPVLAEETTYQQYKSVTIPNTNTIRVCKPLPPDNWQTPAAKWLPKQVVGIKQEGHSAAIDLPTLIQLGGIR